MSDHRGKRVDLICEQPIPRAVSIVASKGDSSRERASRLLGYGIVFGFVVVLVSFLAASAHGQEAAGAGEKKEGYKVTPLPAAIDTPEMIESLEKLAKTYATGRQLGGPEQRKAVYYFQNYLPAVISNPRKGVEAAKAIKTVDESLNRLGRSSNADLYRQVRRSVTTGLGPILRENYSPKAKVIAICLLANLKEPANLQSGQSNLRLPMAAVRPLLLRTYVDEKQADAVRAAALQGLQKHVHYAFTSMQQGEKAQVIKAMDQLIAQEAPADRDPTVHAYLQRIAIDIRSLVRPDGDKAFAETLVSLSNQGDAPEMLVTAAADTLGDLNTELSDQVKDPTGHLSLWAAKTMEAIQGELDRFALMEPPAPAKQQPRDPGSFLREKTDDKPIVPDGGIDPGMLAGGGDEDREGMSDGPSAAELALIMAAAAAEDSQDSMRGSEGPEIMFQEPEYEPQTAEVIAARKRINYVMQAFRRGAIGQAELDKFSPTGGLITPLAEEQKKVVSLWVEKYSEIATELNKPEHETDDKFLKVLEGQLKALDELVTDRSVLGEEAQQEDGKPADPTEIDPLDFDPLAGDPLLGDGLAN
ncbi:MAG: hypothetical protein AAF664_05835 [Planctomycetota bacterium]